MFKIAAQRLYWRPIKVWQPSEDGTLTEASFDVQLRWLPDEKHIDLFKRASAEGLLDSQVAPELVTSFRKL